MRFAQVVEGLLLCREGLEGLGAHGRAAAAGGFLHPAVPRGVGEDVGGALEAAAQDEVPHRDGGILDCLCGRVAAELLAILVEVDPFLQATPQPGGTGSPL